MTPLHRLRHGCLPAVLVALAIAPGTAFGAEAVTMEASPTTVAAGATSIVTARAPVTRTPGVASQEIIQRFDPAQLSLIGATGIKYPQGWTLSYSTNGTTFSTTPPANALDWLLVRAVKATGAVDSEGATEDGLQISEGAASIPVPVAGTFTPAVVSGDGFDAIFDGENRVYNVFHHNGNGVDWGVDCRTRTGAVCWATSGGQTTYFSINPLNTTVASSGWVNRESERLWIPTSITAENTTGFACIDLSSLAPTTAAPSSRPAWCGGSLNAAYRRLGTGGMPADATYGPTYNWTADLAEVDGRLYTWEAATGKLLCVDTNANSGAGAACPGQPYTFSGVDDARIFYATHPTNGNQGGMGRLLVSDGRIYGVAWDWPARQHVVCFDPATGRACTGWGGERSEALGYVPWNQLYEQPNADGSADGICVAAVEGDNTVGGLAAPAGGWPTKCWTAAGNALTPNLDLLRQHKWRSSSNGLLATDPIRVDSRLYATSALGGNWNNYGWVNQFTCWDVATDAACPGFPKAGPYSYSLTVDSENANCFWTNADSGTIGTFDAAGQTGCSLPPPSADLDAQTIVPRMACESEGAVRRWRLFRLTSPATTGYTRATLTVLKDGVVVVSNGIRWQGIPIPRSGLRQVDLEDLAVADTGVTPTFRVTLSSRTSNEPIAAVLQAVGDAPELCLPLTAKAICPAAPAVVPAGDLPMPSPSTVLGDGAAQIAGGTTENFLQGTQAIQVGRPTAADCLGTISGTAIEDGGTRRVPGATVQLLDASGTVIATTTTDANGDYSFARLTAGTGYRVAFGDPSIADPTSGTVSSGSTARTVSVGSATDVDGLYAFPIDAPDRTATIQAGAGALVFDPFVTAGSSPAAAPTTGANFTGLKDDTRLCDFATPADCTKTSVAVDGQGTWSVDANGRITFTPLPSFTGPATPLDYVVKDSTGATATGTLSATVTPPEVNDDRIGTTMNTAKTASVAGNDVVPAGTTFVPATQPANGTLTMNLDGTYTYTPNAGFTGTDTFTYKAWSPPYCPAGGTISSTPIVSGLRYVVGSALQERDAPANLVINGDFSTFPTVDRVGNPIPNGSNYYYWGPHTTTAGLTSLGIVDSRKAEIPSWTSTGGGTGTYANVTTTPPWGTAGDGASAAQAYFGNYWDWTASPWPITFDANTLSRQTYTFTTNSTVNGGNASPITMEQAIPTEVGRTYRLQFAQLAEAASYSGIAGFEIAGYGRTYFEVKSPMRRLTFEFVATSQSTRIAFMNWGHVKSVLGATTGSHELALDDVIGNACEQTAETATVNVVVGPAPTAVADTSTGAFNQNQTVNPLANDTAASQTRPLVQTSVTICGVGETAPDCNAVTRTIDGQGTYSVDQTTGAITFDPVDGYVGQPTPIPYVVADTYGMKATSTYQPTVQPAPPVAPDLTGSAGVGDPVTFNPYATATPSTGSNFTNLRDDLRLCGPDEAPNDCTQTQVVTSQGTWSVANDGVVTFQPATGFSGPVTPIAYTVVDARGLEDAGVLSPTIMPPPTAALDTSSGAWGAEQDINPLANDHAAAGTTLDPTSVRLCPTTVTDPAQCTQTSLTVAGQGTYVVDTATGHVYFNPEPDFIGQASPIAYVVEDQLGQPAMSTIQPTVTPPPPTRMANDETTGGVGQVQSVNPIANDVASTGLILDPATVRLCGPNDTSPDCNQTSRVVIGQGTYAANPTTGLITFTPCATASSNCPNGAFTGAATPIPYSVQDSLGRETAATYTPTVVPPPTAVDDTSTGAWDANQTIYPTVNDAASPPALLDPTSVRLCLASVTNAAQCTSTSLTINGQGTYTVDTATGTVTFNPDPGFTGTATAIQYVVSDEFGQDVLADIRVSVTPPPPPVAAPETQGVKPGGSVAFTTVTGSGGLGSTSGPALVPTSTCLIDPATSQCDPDNSVTIPGEGTYTLVRATGVVTYTALNSATPGPKTPIEYRIVDATGQSDTALLTPVLPTPPTADADISYGEKGAVQTLSPLGNDDPGLAAYPLQPSTLKLCAATVTDPTQCTATTLVVTGQGTFAVQADGTVTFTPCAAAGQAAGCTAGTDYVGDVTQIRYAALDDVGQAVFSTISVKVLPQPVPVPVLDAETGAYGTSITFDAIDNDTGGTRPAQYLSGDVSVDPGSVRLCVGSEAVPNCTGTSLTTADGTYTVNTETGDITFAPAPGFTGTATSPPTYMVCNRMSGTWTIADGADDDTDPDVVNAPTAQCATAPIVPTTQPPGVPAAANDASVGDWDVTQTITPLANDTKDANVAWAPSTLRLCAGAQTPPNCGATTVTVAGQGTYTVNPDGTVAFDPLPGFKGTATAVRYQVEDAFGQVVDATITPTVRPPTAPTAAPETKRVLPGTSVTFTTITGASGLATGTGLQTTQPGATCLIDPTDETLCTQRVVTSDGTWEIDPATGLVTYTAEPGTPEGRKIAVAYRVTDVTGQTATAKLTPIVPPLPTAADDTSRGPWGSPQTLTPLANDESHLVASTIRLCAANQSPPCAATRVTVPEGVYEVVNGTVVFTPDPSFMSGAPTPIAYEATDELGQRASAYLRPLVDPADPPVASPDASQGLWGEMQTLSILANDTAAQNVTIRSATALLCAPTEIAPACTRTRVEVPGVGTYVIEGGTVRFSGELDFVGVAPPLAYRVEDSLGQVTHAEITITVLATSPSVTDEAITLVHGQPGTLRPTVTRGSAPIDPALTCLALPGATSCAPTSTLLVLPEGTYALDVLTGAVRFTPAPGFSGTVANPPSVCVTGTDGRSDCGTLTPTVLPAPPAIPAVAPVPIASPDYATTQIGVPVTFALLPNDASAAGRPLLPSTIQIQDPATGAWGTSVTVPGQGTYVVDTATGDLTFTPVPGYVGVATPVPYRVRTATGAMTASTIHVRVVGTPPPYGNPDHVAGPQGATLYLNALANDAVAGGAAFIPSTLRLIDPVTRRPVLRVALPGQGTYIADPATGVVRFVPLSSFVGTATPLPYTVATTDGRTVRSTLHPRIVGPLPRLRITTTPSVRLLRPGQSTVVTLRACNVGVSTAVGTRVRLPIPVGTELRAARGATVRATRVATWTTGTMAPGQCVTRTLTLTARVVGPVRMRGAVSAVNAARATDPAAVRIVNESDYPSIVTG